MAEQIDSAKVLGTRCRPHFGRRTPLKVESGYYALFRRTYYPADKASGRGPEEGLPDLERRSPRAS